MITGIKFASQVSAPPQRNMIPNGNDYKIYYGKQMIKSYSSDIYDVYIVFFLLGFVEE